jgi:hypothetical protein
MDHTSLMAVAAAMRSINSNTDAATGPGIAVNPQVDAVMLSQHGHACNGWLADEACAADAATAVANPVVARNPLPR